jgi:hypothetical protein
MSQKIKILNEGELGYGLLIESDSGIITSTVRKDLILKENGNGQSEDHLRILVDCILQKANVKNRNGRIYPKHILERELAKYIHLVNSDNSFGETNHPDSPVISLKKDDLSHLIKKFWWEGDTLYGTLEIITSKGYADNGGIYCIGDHIANLLERGYKLGISSRGLGSLKTIRGENYVQDDFELVCWDLVSSPSTPDAYLEKKITKINENLQDTTKNLIKEDKILNFLNKKTIF